MLFYKLPLSLIWKQCNIIIYKLPLGCEIHVFLVDTSLFLKDFSPPSTMRSQLNLREHVN